MTFPNHKKITSMSDIQDKFKKVLLIKSQCYSTWIKQNKLLAVMLFLNVLISSILYFNYNVMNYDEAWFTCCFSYRDFSNHLAYGYFYWLFIDLFRHISSDILHYKFILRLLALISILSVPVVIYQLNSKLSSDRSRYKSIIFLWLTFPAAWWYGKLVAPDLYCLSLGLWGLCFSIPPEKDAKRKTIGIILMGIAVGIKITFIVFPIFYYVYTLLLAIDKGKASKDILLNTKQYLFKEEKMGLFLIVGFLIGSPSIVFRPKEYFEQLTKFSNPEVGSSPLEILFSPSVGNFWETIITPSLTWFSLSLASILFLAVFYKKWSLENKKIAYSFFVSFGISIFLFMKPETFLSWYSYPIITLLLVLLLSTRMPKKYFNFLVVINLIANSPVIIAQISNKAIHIQNHYNEKEIESYIEEKKKNFSRKHVDIDQLIVIRPESGSGILALNSHLISGKPFKKPTFIAVSKIMMVEYGNNGTIYSRLKEIFDSTRIKSFKRAIFSNLAPYILRTN